VPPQLVPQVKAYYECALNKLDELLAREPNDIWAKSYRAFLYTEYTGDLQRSIEAWKSCLTLAPNNPAAYFFLGESYLQQGNLKECLRNISKAVALRALPN
jgi:predicted Zn-dependent protease